MERGSEKEVTERKKKKHKKNGEWRKGHEAKGSGEK